jgi:hypothetical protein
MHCMLRSKTLHLVFIAGSDLNHLWRAPRLELVQIDNTQLDVRVVDESQRRAFGRAWLTDVRQPGGDRFLRLAGAPAAISVVLTHAILPRNEFVYLVHISIMLTRVTLRVGVTL